MKGVESCFSHLLNTLFAMIFNFVSLRISHRNCLLHKIAWSKIMLWFACYSKNEEVFSFSTRAVDQDAKELILTGF